MALWRLVRRYCWKIETVEVDSEPFVLFLCLVEEIAEWVL
jgi:hypothetical protein